MHEGTTVIHGNLVGNPRVNRTAAGDDVANFRVASSARRPNRTGEWVDTDTYYVDVTCWRRVATNVAASLRKGDAVVVVGALRTKEFMVGDQKRRETEIEAKHVGASLARSAVRFLRVRPEESADPDVGPDPGVSVAGEHVVGEHDMGLGNEGDVAAVA